MTWTDEKFLGYVDLHSRTDLAQFPRQHALRLLHLAGVEEETYENFLAVDPYSAALACRVGDFTRAARAVLLGALDPYSTLVSIPVWLATPLIEQARKRLKLGKS